jgi:hypothetical protein
MSSNLLWSPVSPPAGGDLDDQLKFVLRKRFGEPIRATVSKDDVQYLSGLADAGIKGAEQLIELIAENGALALIEQYGEGKS